MITATFTITLDWNILSLQLVYGSLTNKSLPRVKFSSSFALSANPKHYNNEEAITVVNDVIMSYMKAERKRLKLSEDHPSLLIMDVFKSQTTEAVLKVLSDNNIMLQIVPAEFTHLFQPLDVQRGLNGYAIRFMRRKFIKRYTEQITQAMDADQEHDSIDIKLKLSINKQLYAKWVIESYNEMTSRDGR